MAPRSLFLLIFPQEVLQIIALIKEMLLVYPLGAAGAGPRHAAQHAMQPRNGVTAPSQGLPIKISHQDQPVE